jgi:hypothetical protein
MSALNSVQRWGKLMVKTKGIQTTDETAVLLVQSLVEPTGDAWAPPMGLPLAAQLGNRTARL